MRSMYQLTIIEHVNIIGNPNITNTSEWFQWLKKEYIDEVIPSITFPSPVTSPFHLPNEAFADFPYVLSRTGYNKFSDKVKTPEGVGWSANCFTYKLTIVQKNDNALLARGRSASNKREADDIVRGLTDKSKYAD